MNAQDVALAVSTARLTNNTITTNLVCASLGVILPVLHELVSNTSRFKFWLRWGMGVLISALESYSKNVCGNDVEQPTL